MRTEQRASLFCNIKHLNYHVLVLDFAFAEGYRDDPERDNQNNPRGGALHSESGLKKLSVISLERKRLWENKVKVYKIIKKVNKLKA